MLTLPAAIIPILTPFATLFQRRTWLKAQVLLIGVILTPGKRTVTAALRVMGLSHDEAFAKYHHILNRASWSSLKVSRVLLYLLLRYLDSTGEPLVFGMDETLERRRGPQISAKGIYRDAVRSSKSHFVKASGLRWISLMYLAYIPWACRTWALPVLTVLAPSERYYQRLGRAHKRLTDRARQMIIQLRRWLPQRYLVLVADSSYAVLELLHFCQSLAHPVTFITRLRLDAALFLPAPPRRPGQLGRPRKVGQRLPTLKSLLDRPETAWESIEVNWYDGSSRPVEISSGTAVWYHRGKPSVSIRWVLIRDPLGKFEPQALLCTDPEVPARQVIEWFVLRWQLEVTFQEVRAHLGVETQRQWSDLAVGRTTPALFCLFSWVALAAHVLGRGQVTSVRSAAWYAKPWPTFSDAIAVVRGQLWPASATFRMSGSEPDMQKVPVSLFNRFIDTLCYAA
jgi:hypothetical protein